MSSECLRAGEGESDGDLRVAKEPIYESDSLVIKRKQLTPPEIGSEIYIVGVGRSLRNLGRVCGVNMPIGMEIIELFSEYRRPTL